MIARPRTALILGGARSGKSAYGQRLAHRMGEPVLFVATAVARDAEMEARIAAHRLERPPTWQTVEAPLQVGEAIRSHGVAARTVLVDCLTLLVSNCLLDIAEAATSVDGHEPADLDAAAVEVRVGEEVDVLLRTVRESGANLIVVSGEVGLGVVPEHPLGRVFRDVLGRANQSLAASADAVYLMIAGIPVDLRTIAAIDVPMYLP